MISVSSPKIVVMVDIEIGRKRATQALIIASYVSLPEFHSISILSIRTMPLLIIMPARL